MRKSVRGIRRIAPLALVSLASLNCAGIAQAQISLRPESPQGLSRSDDISTRREHPISRTGLPPADSIDNFSAAKNRLEGNAILPPGNIPPTGIFAVPATAAPQGGFENRDVEFDSIQREAEALQRQFGLIGRIVRFASPSIVHIEASKKSGSGKGFASSRIDEAGAGIVINLQNGQYILTNRHVIHPAELDSIRIELNDGTSLKPTNVWSDPSTDVAVLKVSRPGLVPAKLGNSDQMGIGDFVLAVGSPFGLSHSVTYGILSAKGRRNLELGSKEIDVQDFFQTDAAINPGNSGGPLLNLRGEVVAINTAIASNSGGNEGIGFSIPINMAVVVAEQLVNNGTLRRSYLGVQLENAFDILTANRLGLPAARGALVKSVLPNSPAERAGIRVGDVILEFNGKQVDNDGHLVRMVSLTPAGNSTEMIVYRDGKSFRVPTQLQISPESLAAHD